MKQWRCGPLNAWITHGQCVRNRARAMSADTRKNFNDADAATDRLMLRECTNCPGVMALARAGGPQPREAVVGAAPARREAPARRYEPNHMRKIKPPKYGMRNRAEVLQLPIPKAAKVLPPKRPRGRPRKLTRRR